MIWRAVRAETDKDNKENQPEYADTAQIFRNNSEFNSEFLWFQPRWDLECRLNILNIILPLDCVNITCMNHITDFSQFPPRDETLAIPFKL